MCKICCTFAAENSRKSVNNSEKVARKSVYNLEKVARKSVNVLIIQSIYDGYGLFVSMLCEETQSDILRGNLLSYKGAIYENLMADMLCKKGKRLYYYHKPDSIELDFVMRYKDACTIVECKARTGNAKSMQTVLKHPEKYHVYSALKFGDYNVGRNGALLTLPFYMGYLLK